MRRWWEYLRARQISPAVLAGYVVMVLLFGAAFSRYHIPDKGFSYLVAFGGRQPYQPISALKDLDYHVQADSFGYDAQYYVQIAMDPTLTDPELPGAIDNLPYRARRILFSWVAYALGGGEPARILDVYVLENAVAWLLLAVLLLHWFPPRTWGNWLRWSGVLYSFGMAVSVRNSLVDGPSLLLIAAGVLLVEKNKPWLAAAVLGLAGLGKETNLLGAAALGRPEDLGKILRRPGLILRGALAALPLALWLWYIDQMVAPAANAGARNFAAPLAGWMQKAHDVWTEAVNPDTWALGVLQNGTFWSLLMLVALTVQFLYLVLRPQWRQAWWRVGVTFAVLMLVLGDAVWEGYPGAASRVLLPMQLAFNLLVPATPRWWPVLLLGNLTLLSAPAALQPPPGDGYAITTGAELARSGEGGKLRIAFSPEWHETERQSDHYWRWSRGSATMTVMNPHGFPLEAEIEFILSALQEREITVRGPDNEVLWQGGIRDEVTRVRLAVVRLAPGPTTLHFQTDDTRAAAQHDPRRLAFCLKDCTIRLQPGPAEGAALIGPASLLGSSTVPKLAVEFRDGWFEAERADTFFWRWTGGPAEFVLTNRHDGPVPVRMSFVLNAISKRNVVLAREDGRVLWGAEVSSKHSEAADIRDVSLAPGENRFFLRSDLPPSGADNDTRLLDMMVRNLVIEAGPDGHHMTIFSSRRR
ncbi:MAG: hypothetical protein RIS54_1677 [Verrucomicrobiota bacterium]|jgi:hypothetical protein